MTNPFIEDPFYFVQTMVMVEGLKSKGIAESNALESVFNGLSGIERAEALYSGLQWLRKDDPSLYEVMKRRGNEILDLIEGEKNDTVTSDV